MGKSESTFFEKALNPPLTLTNSNLIFDCSWSSEDWSDAFASDSSLTASRESLPLLQSTSTWIGSFEETEWPFRWVFEVVEFEEIVSSCCKIAFGFRRRVVNGMSFVFMKKKREQRAKRQGRRRKWDLRQLKLKKVQKDIDQTQYSERTERLTDGFWKLCDAKLYRRSDIQQDRGSRLRHVLDVQMPDTPRKLLIILVRVDPTKSSIIFLFQIRQYLIFSDLFRITARSASVFPSRS